MAHVHFYGVCITFPLEKLPEKPNSVTWELQPTFAHSKLLIRRVCPIYRDLGPTLSYLCFHYSNSLRSYPRGILLQLPPLGPIN